MKTSNEMFDIWNIYALASITVTPADEQLACIFEKKWPPDAQDAGSRIKLAFHGISHLMLHQTAKIVDVDEVGFKAREDHDLDWLLYEGQLDGTEDMILRLGSAGYIRVNSDQAEIGRIGND